MSVRSNASVLSAAAVTLSGVLLSSVLIRFFRSFNYDYERKAHPESRPEYWERIDGRWYPFVEVPLDPSMTAVVGANESGKSHLIDAIEFALTGADITRTDFCRYSALYSVEIGQVRDPDFGLRVAVEGDDVARLEASGFAAREGQLVTLLRRSKEQPSVVGSDGIAVPLDSGQLAALQLGLPAPFRLLPDVPLPDAVTFDEVLGRQPAWSLDRGGRSTLRRAFADLAANTLEEVTTTVPSIVEALRPQGADPDHQNSVSLARKMLSQVARIDDSAFRDLEQALAQGREGQAGGLIEVMNRAITRHLNFSRWWRQDRDFALRLSPREEELVFTIRDRTGTDYSFSERSRGLTYFLGYYVQLRAHARPSDGRREVLLMDEPDAYLSSTAQQDLLRFLEYFAAGAAGEPGYQVVYVTHSPFLIDKNNAGRVRVLDKGSDEEGTRVVNDAVRNHYEPLRSSIGSFVAETAFLGGSNLLVEGTADQVLLSGINARLRRGEYSPSRLLDLNDVTIVPSGSASEVPYMAYLARGRDELKPACVALLDGDDSGRQAIAQLRRATDGRRRSRILRDEFIVNLAEWAAEADLKLADGVTVVETEDLIPVPLAVQTARAYAERLLGKTSEDAEALTANEVTAGMQEGLSSWKALTRAFAKRFDGADLAKVGFAKELVRAIDVGDARRNHGQPDLEHNFAQLIGHLTELLRQADEREAESRTSKRTDTIVAAYASDHQDGATRDEAARALREIEASLEGSVGDDAVAARLQGIRRDFNLGVKPLSRVDEHDQLLQRLRELKTVRRDAYRADG